MRMHTGGRQAGLLGAPQSVFVYRSLGISIHPEDGNAQKLEVAAKL